MNIQQLGEVNELVTILNYLRRARAFYDASGKKGINSIVISNETGQIFNFEITKRPTMKLSIQHAFTKHLETEIYCIEQKLQNLGVTLEEIETIEVAA